MIDSYLITEKTLTKNDKSAIKKRIENRKMGAHFSKWPLTES